MNASNNMKKETNPYLQAFINKKHVRQDLQKYCNQDFTAKFDTVGADKKI